MIREYKSFNKNYIKNNSNHIYKISQNKINNQPE